MKRAVKVYLININVKKTKSYYEQYMPVECTCNGCRNYKKAIGHIEHQVKTFFEQLGIDIKKAEEIFIMYSNEGTVHYLSTYFVIGEVIMENSLSMKKEDCSSREFMLLEEDKKYTIGEHFQYTYTSCDTGVATSYMQLEVLIDLPWVLEEENIYEVRWMGNDCK